MLMEVRVSASSLFLVSPFFPITYLEAEKWKSHSLGLPPAADAGFINWACDSSSSKPCHGTFATCVFPLSPPVKLFSP